MLDNKGRSREMWPTARYCLRVSVKERRQGAHHKGFLRNRRFSPRTAAGQLRNRPRCWRARCNREAQINLRQHCLDGGCSRHANEAIAGPAATSYRDSLDIARVQLQAGIVSDEAVAQAETQLKATEAQDTNLEIARAQFEHAIAVLLGQPASTFSVPAEATVVTPPAIPVGLPAQLLERRPDVASAERRMAQANAQIGIATAAFFPNVTLTAGAGFESTSFLDWLTWPSRFWSVGPALAQTLFDAGLRRATVEQYQASFNQAVASYRGTVLTAFQQVEDNLAALRILAREIQQQDTAVESAARNLRIATARYRAGIDPYLNVITAQTTLLSNQQTAVALRRQQMTASVQLVEALGGSWNASDLPSATQVAGRGR